MEYLFNNGKIALAVTGKDYTMGKPALTPDGKEYLQGPTYYYNLTDAVKMLSRKVADSKAESLEEWLLTFYEISSDLEKTFSNLEAE